MFKKLWLAVVLMAAWSPAALAIPTLQLYIPDSQYDTASETWIYSGTTPFEFSVIGTYGTNQYLKNLTLDIAVPTSMWENGGSVTLTGPGYPDGVSLSNFTYGTPPVQQRHGIYPTYYVAVPLPDMYLKYGTDITRDYSPSGWDSTGRGIIYTYTMDFSSFDQLHFDASATAISKNGKSSSVFAPYSHDAEFDGGSGSGGSPVPEPASLGLIGIGMLLMIRRRRK